MTNIEITNSILQFFIKRGMKTNLSLDIDHKDDGSCAPQVQIDVEFTKKSFEHFAFFYATDDEFICFSVIYELNHEISEPEFYEIVDLIKDRLYPFAEIAQADDHHYVDFSLFRRIKPEEFNETLLEDILKCFTEKNEVIEKLREMSAVSAMSIEDIGLSEKAVGLLKQNNICTLYDLETADRERLKMIVGEDKELMKEIDEAADGFAPSFKEN